MGSAIGCRGGGGWGVRVCAADTHFYSSRRVPHQQHPVGAPEERSLEAHSKLRVIL